jgi:hypothetical protein
MATNGLIEMNSNIDPREIHCLRLFFQVTVGSGNNPQVDSHVLAVPNLFKALLLEGAQQFHLILQW